MIDLRPQACLIDGQWRAGDRWIDVRNPADDAVVGRMPLLSATDVDDAIDAAARAMPEWSAMSASDRGLLLDRFHDLMLDHLEELAAILTAEQGKPIGQAEDEIRYAASFVRWFAQEGRRAFGEIIPAPSGQRIFLLRQPVGVVAAITPWNFPAAMITRKLAPALAAGCTIVIKPSELTPMTAFALGALAMAAGIPAGVINIVSGDAKTIGDRLLSSPKVRKLSFTGSTQVGISLYEACAPTVKRLSLELGGNAPFIVMDDTDLDSAVDGAIAAKFRNSGQACIAANRFYIQSGIHDRFITALADKVHRLRTGRGDDRNTDVGPVINDAARAKIDTLIADAIDKGAQCLVGGPDNPDRFVKPVILTGVTEDMHIVQQEIFGPVIAIQRFDSEAEVIAYANASEAGLAAYIYSKDEGRAWRMAEALETGMVGVNCTALSNATSPFGGVKASGLGREGARQGLDEYLDYKTLTIAS